MLGPDAGFVPSDTYIPPKRSRRCVLTLNDPSSLLSTLPEGAEVLICRLRSLGDMVLETPVLTALHSWRPDLRICVLVEPWCAPVLEGNPAVAEIIAARGFLKTARDLRRRNFRVVFNQHGGPRSALLTAASGAPRRVCWSGYQFSFLYNVHVPGREDFFGTSAVHMVEHRLSQLYATGLPRGPIPRTQVYPQRDAMESVARHLAAVGIAPGEPYAILQPGARLPGMRWPVEKFAEIARYLRQAHSMASIVNLGRRDDEVGAKVRRGMSGCAVVIDSFNVRELIAVIAGARLFIGNDSGPAHIADAADCMTVVIFGSTNPFEWGPRQGKYRVLHTNAVFRSSAGDKSILVSESRPIHSIEVAEVQQACEHLISSAALPDETKPHRW